MISMMVNMRVEPAPWSLSQGCPGRDTVEGRHTFVITIIIIIIIIIMRLLEEKIKHWFWRCRISLDIMRKSRLIKSSFTHAALFAFHYCLVCLPLKIGFSFQVFPLRELQFNCNRTQNGYWEQKQANGKIFAKIQRKFGFHLTAKISSKFM